MKRAVSLAVLLAALISMPGCGAVLVTAPPGSDVRLLAELEPATSKVTMKNWYVLWGIVPITNNNTADVIGKHGIKSARISTFFSPVDMLINIVLGSLTIYTNTVEIEGNLAK